MNYSLIQKTDIMAPTLTLGTMTFGGQTNETDSRYIMDLAYEYGMTLFDTANIYNQGASETIVGEWLKDKRDKISLATKVGYPMDGGLKGVQLNRASIKGAFNESCKRLQTDYVDIYYMHAPDYSTPMEESLHTMSELVATGKVGYIGVSNFAAWQLADLLAICDKHGYIKPVITQNVYNALTRGIELELTPFLDKHPMALTVYNPIAAGLLAGKHTSEAPAPDSRLADNQVYKNRYWSDANLTTTRKLSALAEANDMSLLALAMKFCTANPKVTTILTGVSKSSQLEQNISSIQGSPLSDDILSEIDLIWQQHTGNPFAYNR